MTGYADARARQDIWRIEDFDIADPAAVDAEFALGIAGGKSDERLRPFKLLRTKFRKKEADIGVHLTGVTSATPGAGKSFITANLAVSLSQISEIPVYCVDLDFRRPSLSIRFGLSDQPGISAVLKNGGAGMMGIGRRIGDSNLVVLPAGAEARQVADMVSSSAFIALIEQLRAGTGESIVLVDMPPAFASDDAMLIMKQLDAYLLVVDSGVTSKRQLREVLSMMDPSPLLGTVMNRFNGGITENYGYGYGYGSKAYGKYY